MNEWYTNRDNLLRVAEILIDDERVTPKELVDFFKEPWKWTDVWEGLNERTQ